MVVEVQLEKSTHTTILSYIRYRIVCDGLHAESEVQEVIFSTSIWS